MPQTSPASPLSQWYVISLRPQNLHAGVRKAASALGARCFALSTLRLQPLDASDDIARVLTCPRVIVSSPAAVRMAQQQRSLAHAQEQQWFAIGSGSASALRHYGIERVLTPELGADSAALLAHPGLQDISGQRIGLITAPDGRGLLERTLRERGAELVVAHVYRREVCRLAKTRITALSALPETSALLVSSGEAFAALWRQLDCDQRDGLRRRTVIASSERLYGLLSQHGFDACLLARDARPQNMLAALAAHVRTGRFR